MSDILSKLFNKYPFNSSQVEQAITGKKCLAIMLKNGNIGVCSTLCNTIAEPIEEILSKANLSNYHHRIAVNTWVNACTNYTLEPSGLGDISSVINFTEVHNLVMIGYFGSLANRLKQNGTRLKIFDYNEEHGITEPMEKQVEEISQAQAIILTSTSIANNTFTNIVKTAKPTCNIYMLGPSTPLSGEMFNNPNIAGLFGARFKPFDFDVLNAIANGGGTRSFLDRMEKVFISQEFLLTNGKK
jgi:hypothetical protein